MNLRKQPRKWDSGPPRQDEDSQQPEHHEFEHKKDTKVGEMSTEILTKNESVKYLGQRISFHQQETMEIKSRAKSRRNCGIEKAQTMFEHVVF